jgi:hypothetical protein
MQNLKKTHVKVESIHILIFWVQKIHVEMSVKYGFDSFNITSYCQVRPFRVSVEGHTKF